jgi:hypothetical protein
VDEAFLRRIQTKIRLDSVSRDDFHEISRRVCASLELEYQSAAIDRLLNTISTEQKQELRACYPRDLIQQVCWTARNEQRKPVLDDSSLDLACRSYFVSR